MLLTFKVGKYEQLIRYTKPNLTNGTNGGGVWHSCTCKDFSFRQLSKNPVGKCKHLIFIYDKLLDKDFITNYVSRLQTE